MSLLFTSILQIRQIAMVRRNFGQNTATFIRARFR